MRRALTAGSIERMRVKSSVAEVAAAAAIGAATLAGPDVLDAAGRSRRAGTTDATCWADTAGGIGTVTVAGSEVLTGGVATGATLGAATPNGAVPLTGGAGGDGAGFAACIAPPMAGAFVKTSSKRFAASVAACGDVRSIVSSAIGFGSARRTGGEIGA